MRALAEEGSLPSFHLSAGACAFGFGGEEARPPLFQFAVELLICADQRERQAGSAEHQQARNEPEAGAQVNEKFL